MLKCTVIVLLALTLSACGLGALDDVKSEIEQVGELGTPCGDATAAFYSAECYWSVDGQPLYPADFNSECEAYWAWIESEPLSDAHRERCVQRMNAWLDCLMTVSGGSTCAQCDELYDDFMLC